MLIGSAVITDVNKSITDHGKHSLKSLLLMLSYTDSIRVYMNGTIVHLTHGLDLNIVSIDLASRTNTH